MAENAVVAYNFATNVRVAWHRAAAHVSSVTILAAYIAIHVTCHSCATVPGGHLPKSLDRQSK